MDALNTLGEFSTVTIMTVQSYVKVFKFITIILVIQLTIYIAIYYACNSGLDVTSGLVDVRNNALNLLLHNISYILFIVSMVVIYVNTGLLYYYLQLRS